MMARSKAVTVKDSSETMLEEAIAHALAEILGKARHLIEACVVSFYRCLLPPPQSRQRLLVRPDLVERIPLEELAVFEDVLD